jgi:hypothetical protein
MPAAHGQHLARREHAQQGRANEAADHRAAPVQRHVLAGFFRAQAQHVRCIR